MTVRFIREASMDDIKREMMAMLAIGEADPTVRRLAEEAIAGKEDQLGAIFNFVRSTFGYTPDPVNYELFISPKRIAEDYYIGRVRSGDCDDHAMLVASMLRTVGYESRIILGDTNLDLELDHAYAQVKTPSGWINMDTSNTRNPMGWVFPVGDMVIIG